MLFRRAHGRVGVKVDDDDAPPRAERSAELPEVGLAPVDVVERVDDRDDPRAWSVQLSPTAPLGPGVAVLEALERDLVGPLSTKDRRALIDLLDRVTTRLSRSTS